MRKKLLVAGALIGIAGLVYAANPVHFTETLPPAQAAGCIPVANGYDWSLTCNQSVITSAVGPQTVTGAQTVNGNFTLNGFQLFTSSAIVLNGIGQTITPTVSYLVLSPNSIAPSGLLSGTPTISTSPILGSQTTYQDGTLLYVASTATVPVELQDNGSLSGSQLFLASSSSGTPVTPGYVVLSSSHTLEFMYSAINKGWTLLSK